MKENLLRDWKMRLEAIACGSGADATIEESLAWSLVQMKYDELCSFARRAYRKGFRSTLDLVHAEFLRRRNASARRLAPAA